MFSRVSGSSRCQGFRSLRNKEVQTCGRSSRAEEQGREGARREAGGRGGAKSWREMGWGVPQTTDIGKDGLLCLFDSCTIQDSFVTIPSFDAANINSSTVT